MRVEDEPRNGTTREHVLDLVLLLGGIVLMVVTPGQILGTVRAVTARELIEDPHALHATLLVHGAAHPDAGATTFLALYLLLHGLVKVAIVLALLRGTTRVYPWAMLALGGFLVFQVYELVVHPTAMMVVLTVLDALILALTWREWRHGRTLHETWRSTVGWARRTMRPAVR
ncbi:DUF2127 domain-containing protein [Brachybacterium aquaticum]|uniref:Putative membrane protein n=1 Tax=Brachybacterium aquaticum TaxID=1432564 RepID=A0A841AB92_9MICO|nr:DUF2127 domain-containing protein [Brachybacterium aquaticum]MBB5831193.1 putative membrane protein [Brachybacterium aquaticum]